MEKLILPPKRDIVSFAFTSPGLVLSTPGLVFSTPGLVLSTPRLVWPTPGLVRNSRRLVKNTSRRVRLGRRSGIITLKMRQSVWWRLFYARVYTYYISRKMYSPIHTMLVFFWFTRVSSVKALISKCSHGQQSIHTGGERTWRVESVSLHTGKPPENQQING